MLASYACTPKDSKGRLYREKPTPYRNEFERDRDRIIHSNAFKRLQYKTQVFVNHEGDHYRNRMTHSIEVSSIARSLCKTLNLCDDLVEGVALAHDLGHTPFGHAGEEALNDCMKEFGGFSHNAHSFKILTSLEQKYASYDGLNLTWEVLEGIVKHNGPIKKKDLSEYIAKYDRQHSLELEKFSSAEAQIASLADDVAYIGHDLEDSIKAGIITSQSLTEIKLLDMLLQSVRSEYKGISESRITYEMCRKLTHHLIESLLYQTRENIRKYKVKTHQDIRDMGVPLVEFTPEVTGQIKQIKNFLMQRVYKHHQVALVTMQSKRVVKKLFAIYSDDIHLLPFEWNKLIESDDKKSKALVIANYIAGMTDRYAIKQYQSFYNLNFANLGL